MTKYYKKRQNRGESNGGVVFFVRSIGSAVRPSLIREGLFWKGSSQIIFWEEVSRPVFLVSRGVVRDFHDVVIFIQKKQGIFRYIPTFQPQKSSLFQINRVRNWIEETGGYRDIFKLLSWRNGKQRCMPLAKWLVGLQEKRARFARFPAQTRLRRCWNLDFQKPKPDLP